MGRFALQQWFALSSSREEANQNQEQIREAFGLSRWFSGIAGATDEDRARDASPDVTSRIRGAVDTLPVTLFEFDANGIYTCAAGKYVGLFGVSTAQIVGRSVFDFPRFVPGKNMMVRRALAGEAVSFTGIWPLGRYMIRLQPRFDADGRVEAVVGLGIEFSKPAQADKQIDELLEALRQSETRFRAMCESAPLGIYVSNTDFEIGYVNPAFCGLLDRAPDELLGRRWLEVVHPEDRSWLQTFRAPGARRRSTYDGVLRFFHRDGSQVWTSLRIAEMRDGGEALGHVGVITDITQERAARLAADRAQQDLRRVIESSPQGIAVVRGRRWIFVNRAMTDALGHRRPEDLIGKDAGDLVHPDDASLALELTAQADAVWTGAAPREVRYRRAAGDYALMEITPAALAEFEGAPAVLITARDITERKRLQAQLLVSERLLSVGTLAAGVAHEINNPLAAVLSNLEWVAERLARSRASLPGGELLQLEGPIGEAREAAERVRAIVRDLKLFSRAEEEYSGPVDLTRVLDSAARMAWNEVRHRARFVREYGALPPVRGSEARLAQVFLNLIVNAAQAIPEGHADENEIRLYARSLADGQVIVEVRDTGCGIAPDIIGRIFDPFFTTKPPGYGTGLGLAICHRIVSSVGGRIHVESQPGRGTAFRVTLAIAGEEAQPAQPTTVVPEVPASMGRVLVIDDDPGMANALALVLAEDHEVEVFTSARRALARLHAGERYDAIVCDVMMPEMSGIDFHAELERLAPELADQIIFLTGGAFTVRAREFLDRIPNACLDKPFDSASLRSLVSSRVVRGTT